MYGKEFSKTFAAKHGYNLQKVARGLKIVERSVVYFALFAQHTKAAAETAEYALGKFLFATELATRQFQMGR
ncbi:MAG: hypothetical protein ACOYYF_02740 [Chloroflexota bacterium]|nr:hypothetical protein [Chloroflexota bacterium]MBI5703590.1 hypothetical protein [Chloroflexota bacterium]